MCAEGKKEESSEDSKASGCCTDNFAGMFEGMKEFCGGEDKASACREKMKSMMSACCGTGAGGASKEGCCQ